MVLSVWSYHFSNVFYGHAEFHKLSSFIIIERMQNTKTDHLAAKWINTTRGSMKLCTFSFGVNCPLNGSSNEQSHYWSHHVFNKNALSLSILTAVAALAVRNCKLLQLYLLRREMSNECILRSHLCKLLPGTGSWLSLDCSNTSCCNGLCSESLQGYAKLTQK